MNKKNIKHLAVEAIQKKLLGKKLTYGEIYAVMDQISQNKLGDVLATYFVASGYSHGFSDEEIYHLTRAMVETGDRLKLSGIVADKHSIGGMPGNRTTLIVVPIIASAGYLIPKSSSRAITTPAGTADVMEVFAKVSFTISELEKILSEANGCIVWGGSFNIAPADDEIIRLEEPLLFESYDKILVSVMAKKIAFCSNHVVIDIPYGKSMKVHRHEDAVILRDKFVKLAKSFDMKLTVLVEKSIEPTGNGIGPLLEGRDALMVLEQHKNRPIELEKRALRQAAALLSLCLSDSPATFADTIIKIYKTTYNWASDILVSGQGLLKFREIVKAQGGNPEIESNNLKPASNSKHVQATTRGKIMHINSKNLTIISRILGCPDSKKSGIFLYKRVGESVNKGEILCELYSAGSYKLKEATETLDIFPIFEIEN